MKKRKRERRFRGVDFSCFSFLSKGLPRENIVTEEKGWGAVGLRGLSFLLYTYVSLLAHLIDFMNEKMCLVDDLLLYLFLFNIV